MMFKNIDRKYKVKKRVDKINSFFLYIQYETSQTDVEK